MRVLTGHLIFGGLAFVLFTATSSIAQSPGDTVGWTQYPYQCEGSTGTRIAVDSHGYVHVTWMGGSWPSGRGVYYNCRVDGEWIWPGQGGPIAGNMTGFPQLALTSDDRAVIMYHRAIGAESIYVAIDVSTCFGVFDYYRPPNRDSGEAFIWPYGAVDRNGRIHVVATQISDVGDPQMVMYTRSDNGGGSWLSMQTVDTLMTVSTVMAASPVSDKVAIVYCHPTDMNSQAKNDVFYIESPDGLSWDLEDGKINTTNYGLGGDSLFACTEVDAIYDYDDNLHIMWNAQYVTDDGFSDRVFLYHFSDGVIDEVTRYDMPQTDSCQFGPQNLAINKASMEFDTPGALFTVYTRFDTADCSRAGQANGELYMQYSADGGHNWYDPVNLTNSHTPDCDTGECASDEFPSLADVIDGNINVFYECISGGSENVMLYLEQAITRVTDDARMPANFSLSQNYPNPFNAVTRIDFTLRDDADVRLAIYDITGALVQILTDKRFRAGAHSAVWDASQMASGVYYYRLSTNEGSRTKRMVLLK